MQPIVTTGGGRTSSLVNIGCGEVQAGKMMGMTLQYVSKILARTQRHAAPLGMREQNWTQRVPVLLAREEVVL